MEDRKKIVDRVRKLMFRATHPETQEAESAKKKAMQLMADHGLTWPQVTDHESTWDIDGMPRITISHGIRLALCTKEMKRRPLSDFHAWSNGVTRKVQYWCRSCHATEGRKRRSGERRRPTRGNKSTKNSLAFDLFISDIGLV